MVLVQWPWHPKKTPTCLYIKKPTVTFTHWNNKDWNDTWSVHFKSLAKRVGRSNWLSKWIEVTCGWKCIKQFKDRQYRYNGGHFGTCDRALTSALALGKQAFFTVHGGKGDNVSMYAVQGWVAYIHSFVSQCLDTVLFPHHQNLLSQAVAPFHRIVELILSPSVFLLLDCQIPSAGYSSKPRATCFLKLQWFLVLTPTVCCQIYPFIYFYISYYSNLKSCPFSV